MASPSVDGGLLARRNAGLVLWQAALLGLISTNRISDDSEQPNVVVKAMSTRTNTVEVWRTRLAESQQRVKRCPAHRRWIHQIYTRVYRFLISYYGPGEWQAPPDAGCRPDTHASRMEFVDNTEGEQGAPPKSAERIRATLDAVHDARENPPKPGQFCGGLEFSDWVAVASESSRISPRRFMRLLRLNDIEARQIRRGDDVIVEVFAGRRAEAMELLEHRKSSLKIPPRHIRRAKVIDSVVGNACFGAFVGAAVGAAVGALPMLLLMLILDAVYSPLSSSARGTIVSVVLSVCWGVFILVGAIVAVFRRYKQGH